MLYCNVLGWFINFDWQEVQWNDIDYAVNRMDWTLNNDTYGHLPNIVHELHNIGMKYMMIVVSRRKQSYNSILLLEQWRLGLGN